MDEFSFDAPMHYNFFGIEKANDRIHIDPKDPNDAWFLVKHIELTPIKFAQVNRANQEEKDNRPNKGKPT